MSNLSQETIDKIKADAERYASVQWSEKAKHINHAHSTNWDNAKEDYEAGATAWAAKTCGLIDLLDEAHLQIEYLHKKFGETGSGNNVLARIETELAKYKEVSNG